MAVYETRLDLMNMKPLSLNMACETIRNWCYPAKINAIGKYKTRDYYYVIPTNYTSYCQLLNKLQPINDNSMDTLVFTRPVVEKNHFCPYNSILGSNKVGIKHTNYDEYPYHVKIANFPKNTSKSDVREWLASPDSHVEDVQLIKMENSITAIVKFSFVYEAFLSLFRSGKLYNKRVLIVKKFRLYGRKPNNNSYFILLCNVSHSASIRVMLDYLYPFIPWSITTTSTSYIGIVLFHVNFRSQLDYFRFLKSNKFTIYGNFIHFIDPHDIKYASDTSQPVKDPLSPCVLNLLHLPRSISKQDLFSFMENRNYDEIKILHMNISNLGENYQAYCRFLDNTIQKPSTKMTTTTTTNSGMVKPLPFNNSSQNILYNIANLCLKKHSEGKISIQYNKDNKFVGIIDSSQCCSISNDSIKQFFEPTLAKIYFKNYYDTRYGYFLAGKKFKDHGHEGYLIWDVGVGDFNEIKKYRIVNLFDVRGFQGPNAYNDIIEFFGTTKFNAIEQHKYGHFLYLSSLHLVYSILNRDGEFYKGKRISVSTVFSNDSTFLNAILIHNLPPSDIEYHLKCITINYKYGYYEKIHPLYPNTSTLLIHFDSPDDYYNFSHLNGLYYEGRTIKLQIAPKRWIKSHHRSLSL